VTVIDRRPLLALVAAVASASTAYIAVWVVSSLIVLDITGSAVAAGVPSALAALATAFGAIAVANLGIRWTRPRAIAIGFVAAVIGCGLAYASIAFGSLVWLFAASLGIGIGNGALQQTRYAAADTAPADRRAWALGLAVWGSTVGAVFGPNLVGLGEALAEPSGADPLVVSLVIIGALFVLAVVLALVASRWSARPAGAPVGERPAGWAGGHVLGVARDPRLRAALAALLGGQVAMVLIMTMTDGCRAGRDGRPGRRRGRVSGGAAPRWSAAGGGLVPARLRVEPDLRGRQLDAGRGRSLGGAVAAPGGE
jgi:MFS family permease